MSPTCPFLSLPGALRMVLGVPLCIFWYGSATPAGLDTGIAAVPPPSLKQPNAPEGWSLLNLSVDTPRGARTKTVMIRDDADDAEVRYRDDTPSSCEAS